MPIKPENLTKYPPRAEWAKIRAEVLARDRNRCKRCGVPNHAWGIRWPGGTFTHVKNHQSLDGVRTWASTIFPQCRIDPAGHLWLPGRGKYCRRDGKVIRIVLTISHLDHDPANNGRPGDRPNLAALCQRCHNRHDGPHRAANAAETRKKNLESIEKTP